MKSFILGMLMMFATFSYAGERFNKMTYSEHLHYAKDAIAKHALIPAKMHLDAIPTGAREYTDAKKLYAKIGAENNEAIRKQLYAKKKGHTHDENITRAAACASTLKSASRNPDSFVLESANIKDDGSICYTFRSQNGFGGMERENAVLYGADIIKISEMEGFRKKWNKYCAGKNGEDIKDYLEMYLR